MSKKSEEMSMDQDGDLEGQLKKLRQERDGLSINYKHLTEKITMIEGLIKDKKKEWYLKHLDTFLAFYPNHVSATSTDTDYACLYEGCIRCNLLYAKEHGHFCCDIIVSVDIDIS